MRASELTSRDAVLRAISEYDEKGRDAFLEEYGFRRSHRYQLVHEGKQYDSKAIAGAALGWQYGTRENLRDGLHGGLSGVVPVLRSLGFTVIDVGVENGVPDDDAGVPEELRRAWEAGAGSDPETDARREAALPELNAILDRFLKGETGLAEFAKENQDFAFEQPHWGFKGYAQMLLNQYAKVAQASGLVEEAEGVLREGLRAPEDDEGASESLRSVLELTKQLAEEAGRLGVGKPAPGRVAQVVSYFWEAQDRENWPIAYPATKEVLAKFARHTHARARGVVSIAPTLAPRRRRCVWDRLQAEVLEQLLERRVMDVVHAPRS